ncbi:MAG: SdpI family protein [Lachnospiraceae bacterium]|nr:SdpI family protein [Lachnospiraceae bacterium]
MGFWIFLTICNLMIPALMIVIGKVFIKNPPKTINGIYGYRTSRSRKNQDTWNFAHLYCGKLWWKIGWVMLPLAVISMLPVIKKNDNIVGGVSAAVIMVECIAMFMTIFLVERALAKKFDKDGNINEGNNSI